MFKGLCGLWVMGFMGCEIELGLRFRLKDLGGLWVFRNGSMSLLG